MRRTLVIVATSLLLMAGGAACLLAPPLLPAALPSHWRLDRIVGAALLAMSSLLLLRELACLGRAQVALARRLGGLDSLRAQAPLAAGHPSLVELAGGINRLVGLAQQATEEALGRLRELQIQLKLATAEREHAHAVIHSISDAVLVTDPFDELVLANDSAARTFNFALESAARSPIGRLLQDPAIIELMQEMRQSRSVGGRRVVEHAMESSEGRRTFKVTLSCVADEGGDPAGVVAVLHDMTREKEVAEMKNTFVSHVSHELRTPLASIKAYAEMLVDGEAHDERTRQEFYEVIQNEANRLGRLIDNILNVARIESGMVKINKQPQSLMVLAKEALEVIAPQARQKRISLVEQLAPAFYQTLIDKDMILEAVMNLLSNAVKYTPEGGRVTFQTAVDEAGRKVSVRISDTGVGIAPKDLPFVFDKFYRCESNSRMAKGTGLGLSLVKHVVEVVHHGRVFVESEAGRGSTFGFELELC